MTQPDHLRFGFLCIALNHRMNQMRKDHDLHNLPDTYYRYRGMALRSLAKDIEDGNKRETDAVMASVMTLLLTDTQAGCSHDWHYHFRALEKLIRLRGGVHQLARSPSLESMLLSFSYIAVISNTTSPSLEIGMSDSQLEELHVLLDQYGHNVFAFQLCPPDLFGGIVHINRIRMRAAKHATAGNEVDELRLEAHTILAKIDGFSSSAWAESKPASTEHWKISGDVYKRAVLIYCILSLQGLFSSPDVSVFQERCRASAQELKSLLSSGVHILSLKRFMLWPLIVLGVAGSNSDSNMRAFVSAQLPELSRFSGLYAPIIAKQVLERFWTSGDTSWDACFDRPYAFTMHTAIDVSRI
ncbi:fungal-specific transcription factor domain-containing protein [Pestalotiopsis sp. NC0098]|nr:fungal-specific transcription factor domain-containing protein [Pestalotiopsis sp. NC0098]